MGNGTVHQTERMRQPLYRKLVGGEKVRSASNPFGLNSNWNCGFVQKQSCCGLGKGNVTFMINACQCMWQGVHVYPHCTSAFSNFNVTYKTSFLSISLVSEDTSIHSGFVWKKDIESLREKNVKRREGAKEREREWDSFFHSLQWRWIWAPALTHLGQQLSAALSSSQTTKWSLVWVNQLC